MGRRKHNITILTDGIPQNQKESPEFQAAYQDMLAQLKTPGFVARLCAHEAAHSLYFRRMGIINCKPCPATIRYDPIKGYFGSLASMMPDFSQLQFKGTVGDWLLDFAKAHVAGGVISKKMLPNADSGEGDDKDTFKRICASLNQQPNTTIDIEDLWKKAEDGVRSDLEDARWFSEIQEEGLRLRSKLGF